VYEGIDIESNMQVAIKVQKNRDSMNLDREVHMLTRLQGISGVPKLYWSGQENNQNVMVI
jgi:predicted Ser/Thr protein kinase